MQLKIILADDQQIVRTGLRALVSEFPSLDVVAEAQSSDEVLAAIRAHAPDLIVVDLEISGSDPLELASEMLGVSPQLRIIALLRKLDRYLVSEVLKRGVRGYVLKTCPVEELILAIRAVASGRSYLSSRVADVLVQQYVCNGNGNGIDRPALTVREQKVLQLLADGYSSKLIAAELSLSVKTIDAHRQQIMDKLGIRSIAQLTKYAIRTGLSPLEA